MEFKDRLRKLREERGLTQKQLADAIYVSRSAVAKWENGLGLPGDAAYESLCGCFGVTKEEFPLTEEAAAVVRRNEIIAALGAVLLMVGLVLTGFSAMLLIARWDPARPFGDFGFTRQMAVGYDPNGHEFLWIETPDYAFEYFSFREGEENEKIAAILPVKKLFIGWKCVNYTDEPGYIYGLTDEAGEDHGVIYAFSGKEAWYYFVWYDWSILTEGETEPQEVIVDGETISLYKYRYFTTDEPVTELEINGHKLTVSDTYWERLREAMEDPE